MLYLPTIIAMLIKYGPEAVQIAEIYGPPAVRFAQAVWPLIQHEIDANASPMTNVKVGLAALGAPAIEPDAQALLANRLSAMA